VLKTALHPVETGEDAENVGERFLRRPEVERITGLGRSTLYLYIADGRFPRPIKLSERLVAWVESEVRDWMEKRIASREEAA